MNELFNMNGYEFYVWGSVVCFVCVVLLDMVSLKTKKKQAERKIKAMHKRAKR